MPRKSCNFCECDGSAFELKDELKKAMQIPPVLWDTFKYICYRHFEEDDVTTGTRQRLKPKAFPIHFSQPLSSFFEAFIKPKPIHEVGFSCAQCSMRDAVY
jgi:hypothetical protein